MATKLFRTVIRPTLLALLMLDLFVDADFVSLYKHEPDWLVDSVRSSTGFIITLCGYCLICKSFLQTEISLSTLIAENSALANALTLLPLKRIIEEALRTMKLPKNIGTTVLARAFNDNQGAYFLAKNQQIMNRTKYFLLKFHGFWAHINAKEFKIYKINTKEQQADFLTKGLSVDDFKANRRAVPGW
jgi:hypothetical protein